jgi:hypothetical protein
MNQRAFVGAVLLGSLLGLLIAVQVFGTGYDLQRNDFGAGVIMLSCMGAVYWFLNQLMK